MKDRMRLLPMKALSALSLLCCLMPLCVLMGRRILPDKPMVWYLLPGIAFLWGIAGYLLPQRARLPFAMAGGVALTAGCVVLLVPCGWETLLLLVPCWGMLLLLPPAWSRPLWDEWPFGLWVGSALLHLAAQFLSTRESFAGTGVALSVALAAFVFLMLMTINRQSLRTGMHGAQKAPASLRHRNMVLVIVLFVLALLIGCWRELAAWLRGIGHEVWSLIRRGIVWLVNLFSREEEILAGDGMGGGGIDLSALGEAAEPSAFAQLMEKIFIALAAVAMVILAFFACRFLFRWLKVQLGRLVARLRQYAASSAEDYVDEAESILHLDEKAQAIKARLRHGFTRARRETPWKELDGPARVRRLYQQYLRRHPDDQACTAREALQRTDTLSGQQAKTFISLYEQARYSDHPVSTEDADQLRDALK